MIQLLSRNCSSHSTPLSYRKFNNAPDGIPIPTLSEEAALQALSEYHETPARYDPDHASLRHYLAMAAYRDFQNARKKELRVQAHQVSLFDPALRNIPGNLALTEPDAIISSQDQIAELLHLVEELFH